MNTARRIYNVLFISVFATMLGLGVVSPLLPLYAENLGATGIWLGIIFSAFALSRSVFMPIIAKLGIDPIHFGLILVLNLMIGLLTPPVGMVLFVLQKVSGLSFERTVAAVAPWMIPLFVTLGLITYVPQLVLWLPRLLYP